jgi:hypothetical protein
MQETKDESIYLSDDFKLQVKIGTSSGQVVINDIQCFILVIFKSHVPKGEVHELCDTRHNLSMCCERYITSENTQLQLSKNE